MMAQFLRVIMNYLVQGAVLFIFKKLKNMFSKDKKEKTDKKISKVEKKFTQLEKENEKELLEDLDSIDSDI